MPGKGFEKAKKGVRISGIMVPPEVHEKIDQIVAKIPNMTRSQFCSNLLMIGLEDAKILDGLGVYTSMKYVRSLIELIKNITKEEIEEIA